MKVVTFHGTCAAAASVVLVSQRISTPFKLKNISARFAQGCNNLLALRFYNGDDSDAPAAGPPNGISMLRDYGQVDYIVGNDDTKSLDHDLNVEESGTFLKVYAVNTDPFVHSVDVQMTIKELERG